MALLPEEETFVKLQHAVDLAQATLEKLQEGKLAARAQADADYVAAQAAADATFDPQIAQAQIDLEVAQQNLDAALGK